MSNKVFVLDKNGKPLMPCHSARARKLMKQGRAKPVRRQPFTIKLFDRTEEESELQDISFKLDPGSKITGMALVVHGCKYNKLAWAANLHHRSYSIKKRLQDRAMYRKNRRNRKTRNRKPCYMNRSKPKGWLPPSLQSRVDNIETWVGRILRWTPASFIVVETVKFDTHSLSEGRKLYGKEYQQGTLEGWNIREYLLHRHDHTCVYCEGLSNDPVLEIEHVQPRSRGGTNRVSNLVIACKTCNQNKGNRMAQEWAQALTASNKADKIRKRNAENISKGKCPQLKDAAAVNATRNKIAEVVQSFGVPVEFGTGAQTKMNRSAQGYFKDHWVDAACVGEYGNDIKIANNRSLLDIQAMGRGKRQVCRVDRYGFPVSKPGRIKKVGGLQTGDIVKLTQTRGKYRGVYEGTISAVQSKGRASIKNNGNIICAPIYRFEIKQHFDGYKYEHKRNM